jgi:hypothetical protein
MNLATSKTKSSCSVYAMSPVSCYKTEVHKTVILLITFFLSACKNLISLWRQNRNYAKKKYLNHDKEAQQLAPHNSVSI